jgi:uncharacterized protein (DUF2126 family)
MASAVANLNSFAISAASNAMDVSSVTMFAVWVDVMADTGGEFIATERCLAWHPPSGLHPAIGVQAPLVFNLVDSLNGRSVG